MIENVQTTSMLTALASTVLVVVLLTRSLGPTIHRAFPRALLFTLVGLSGWMILQCAVASNGFYAESFNMPPRLMLFGVGPMIVTIGILLFRPSSRAALMHFDIRMLTLLHLVRIPVEVGLHQLAVSKLVPFEMTYEGWNYDIIMGLSAPIAFYSFSPTTQARRTALKVWNIVGLVSLFNIVSIAIRATPYFASSLQFSVPNIAVLYFPWVLLPTCIVPIVLFAHCVSLMKLFQKSAAEV